VLTKLHSIAPRPEEGEARDNATVSHQARVTSKQVSGLIQTATSVNVCLMPPTWHPWF